MPSSQEDLVAVSGAEISEVCEQFQGCEFICIDTEFHRERTYWPILCLVQVSGSNGQTALIDAQAEDFDQDPLSRLLASEETVKVFHAARQDLEIFFHLFGFVPDNVFDTQVAAMVIGLGDQVAYDRLVQQLLGIQIDKSVRFTDWRARPLSQSQLRYALSDVTHLATCYRMIRERLEASGRGSWVEQEMAKLMVPGLYHTCPEDAWRRIRTRNRHPRFRGLLRELTAVREAEAQRLDVPRGRVLKDESLIELATNPPQNSGDLKRIRGMSQSQKDGRVGQELLAAVKRAQPIALEKVTSVSHRPPNGVTSARAELLGVLLRIVSEKEGVAPRLIADSADLDGLSSDPEENHRVFEGWRNDLFGQKARELLDGRLVLRMVDGQVSLEPFKD